MADDIKHGVDYLVDFYALLGVSRKAKEKTIKEAFREKIQQYHTDRYQGLAPILKSQADQMAKVLNEASAILTDSKMRKAYNKQLAEWTGPISESGMPVIDISKPYLSVAPLLSGKEKGPAQKQVWEQAVDQLSGHNPDTFVLLERLYNESDDPPKDLEAAYREALRKRDLHIELHGGLAWQEIGYENRPGDKQLPSAYAEMTTEELTNVKERLQEDLAPKLALIHGGQLKALGSGSEEITEALEQDPNKALAHYQAVVDERFEKSAEKIRALAREREIVIKQRLDLVEHWYWPEQNEFLPKLLACIEIHKTRMWFAFAHTGDGLVSTDESVDTSTLSSLVDSEDDAKKWLDKGYSIVFFKAEDNIDFHEQVEEVVSKHFDKVPEQDN